MYEKATWNNFVDDFGESNKLFRLPWGVVGASLKYRTGVGSWLPPPTFSGGPNIPLRNLYSYSYLIAVLIPKNRGAQKSGGLNPILG